MTTRSITWRLVNVLIGFIGLCWIIVLFVALPRLDHRAAGTWDEKLQAIATQLLLTIPADSNFEDGARGKGLLLPESNNEDEEALVFQIWLDQSVLVASNPGAPFTPLEPSFARGASTHTIDGVAWRVFSATDSTNRITVQAASLQAAVDADRRQQASQALALTTAMLLLACGVMWLVVRSAVRPVWALGAAMRNRGRFDFTPFPLRNLPRDLHPLVDSFNHILAQLNLAIEGERRFIGDAAHELRTPLSTIQAQAEIALKAERTPEKDAALRKLLLVAQRSARLSEQLLDLARLTANAKAPRYAPADLKDLILYVAQEFEAGAVHSRRSLFLDVHAAPVMCNIDEIGILLRNLIDNSMRYTNEGGNVLVRCGFASDSVAPGNKFVFLAVCDDGPGIPESERNSIFDRFQRGDGARTRGSGIGLSLVAEIAEVHGGEIILGPGLGGNGLGVHIEFPAHKSSAKSERH